MSDTSLTSGAKSVQRTMRLRTAVTVSLFVIAAVVAIAGVWRFVRAEQARDVRAWQTRLDLIADSRAAEIGKWLDAQIETLSSISGNTAVQLYVMQLVDGGTDATAGTEPPERSYLRNLLLVTAERSGYLRGSAAPQVPANVEPNATSGLAIVTRDGRPLVTTPGMPALDDSWRLFLANAPPGRVAVRDIYIGATEAPTMGFATPLYRVQADSDPNQQIAWVVGTKAIAPELYPLLRQPGTTEKTLETLLVQKSENVIEFLSPLLNGRQPLQQRSVADASHLASAWAIGHPGAIGSLRDYRDRPVLFTSRTLPHVPWLLVEKIDREEALADSDVRANRLLILFLVAIAAVGIAFVAVWYHGASVRAGNAAAKYRAIAGELDDQKRLLNLVTDSVPDSIFIAGADSKLQFANKRLGDRFGLPAADLSGKPLASVFGPEDARRYGEEMQSAVAAAGRVVTRTDRSGEGAGVRVNQTRAVALARDGGRKAGVLVLESDVTEVVRAREKQEAMLRRLIATLVKIVDQRDPSAAGQSERVAEIAREIATEMKLDPLSIETAATAGRLVNFWKVLVPSDVLTRPGPLSEEEASQSRQAALRWADFVDGIGFDGPVAETLRQVHESYDGNGWPRGLKERQLLITSQIVAMANRVVAMTSNRAYRKGADLDEVARLIGGESGKRYLPGVVAAFLNCIENRGGRTRWASVSESIHS